MIAVRRGIAISFAGHLLVDAVVMAVLPARLAAVALNIVVQTACIQAIFAALCAFPVCGSDTCIRLQFQRWTLYFSELIDVFSPDHRHVQKLC